MVVQLHGWLMDGLHVSGIALEELECRSTLVWYQEDDGAFG